MTDEPISQVPPLSTRKDILSAWQERIFSAIFLSATLVGIIAYVSSTLYVIHEKIWTNAVIYTLGYWCLVIIVLVRRIPFRIRAGIGLGVFYIFGLVSLMTTGPISSGRPWLFAFATIASLLLGLRAGLIALALNVSTMFVLGCLLNAGQLEWALATSYSTSTWIITSITFLLLNTVITISLAALVHALKQNLAKEQNLTAELTAANKQLESEIVERKRAEESLRESEKMYRLLADNASDCIWMLNLDYEFTYINPAVFSILGFTPQEWIGSNLSEHCSPAEMERVKTLATKALENPETFAGVLFQVYLYHKNGDNIAVEVMSRILYDEQDRSIGLQGSTRDITERKQAEEERERLLTQIQEQARQMQRIVDTVPEGVLLLGADGRIILANPAAEGDLSVLTDARVGDTLTRLGDRPLAELLAAPPNELWHEVTTDDRIFETIVRHIETGLSNQQSKINNRAGWVMVVRDVTREREIQLYSQQQERLATVGQLAAGIAHDFNNIMSVIILCARVPARVERMPRRIQERLSMIEQQAWHATNLIRQILDFGRQSVFERKPLALSSLLEEQIKLLKVVLPKSIKIDLAEGTALSAVEGADEYTINADQTRIQQMVMNLAVNARDAMPKGGNLRFGLERMMVQPDESLPLPEMEAGEWVRLTVSDTGTGIPLNVLQRIFDPFFTTKEIGKGSGLGLSQVHGIIKQHGGHIGVQSQVGQGTTFTVYLPALHAT